MEFIEVSAKSLDEAITQASIQLGVTSDQLQYEVVEKGSTGFLGIGSKNTVIKVGKKGSVEDRLRKFLGDVFDTMGLQVEIKLQVDEENHVVDVDLSGNEMGVVIGKRGQTLDSLQYLSNLAANKNSEQYYKIKIDTENYRKRRKETLENLAKNVAGKVKRSRRPIALEPMNPYERRVIHYALQNDSYVTTESEGDEPFRHVVIVPAKKY